MGYMRHHAIVVSGWVSRSRLSGDPKDVVAAHGFAKTIFPWVSELSAEATNGYRSFFIPPDGSKEGWETSTDGDRRRDLMIDWLERHTRYDDGSSPVDWVEVQFGDDDWETRTTRDSDEIARSEHAQR